MSLRGAINAKCKECIYDPVAGRGSWRQQVEACTSRLCPLFRVRPLSDGAAEIDRRSTVEIPADSGLLQTMETPS